MPEGVAQMDPTHLLLMIVALITAVTLLVQQAGNLASALEETVRKFQRLKKIFQK